MALVTQLVRRERFDEVAGCPLRRPRPGVSESACRECRFNALAPGVARIGCVAETSLPKWDKAERRLAQISLKDHRRLLEILAAERKTPDAVGLGGEEILEVKEILTRWWELVSNDPDEREVVATLLRLTTLAASAAEPLRVLA